ncbi:MAG: filamentous hemagglutinin N-terminal domain-containing protein [Phenylobacterium sp.]|uniref:beta strand repeat-containing protein n=1 Tax=Phenylobacterium sp. TaxID=1871053 RepID=UPI001A59A406|nr:filamentous hemagglutinin N-terminal domain-containing protein [Phenylobacterium sp.]MBL8556761.1 filamentous hemagglutinin N-terminal domain-containing protein [Phenylobacterium sp.]
MGASKGAVAALGLVLAGWPMAALGQTAISPDVAAGRGLGTTVGQAGTVYTVDGGTRAGNNLFHSFGRFDLGAGDTARWVRAAGDGATIANVVNRVTGGTPSTIAGTLDSTALPNAAFWFVNPAGIVFGAGAVVNVPSAAHFSTSAELRFADGARFSAATPSGSTLSIAAPESFGFLGGQGDIDITGVGLGFVPGAAALTFTAANVSVSDSTFAARGLDLIAVGNQSTAVRLADPLSAARGGTVNLARNRLAVVTADTAGAPARFSGGEVRFASTSFFSVSTGAGRGGDVVVQGRRVVLAPDAFVGASASGTGAGGDLRVTAGTIEVDARGATTTTGFGSTASAAGAAGAVTLNADTIRLTGEVGNTAGSGFAFIGSTVLGTGSAGDVNLTATNLVIDIGLISSSSVGNGDGGDIRLSGRALELGGANIITSSFGDGAAGNVIIDGDTVAISGGSFGATPGSRMQSGELVISATTSIEAEGGFFSAISGSPTSSGRITVRAPLILLSQTRIDTQAFDQGLAGQITLEADQLLLDRIFLTSDSDDGSAATGVVRLKSTGDLILFQGSYSASVNGVANGGRIEIEGRNVLLDGALIQTDTAGFGTGDAGQISITATEDLTLDNTGVSSSSDSVGRGGNVTLRGRNLRIENQSALLSQSRFAGDAGQIDIFATGSLNLDAVDILSQSFSGTGNGGSVRIEAGRLFMVDTGVSSDTNTSGRAGTVSVRAGQIELDGVNRNFTFISSSTTGDGDAGSVTLDAQSITLRNGAYIASESGFTGALGNSGDITIRTGDLSLIRGGQISTLAVRANGGDVSIAATGNVTMTSEPGFNSVILAAANGAGDAGNINLNVGGILRLNGSTISSDTFGEGNAGQLTIKANTLALAQAGDRPSAITSSTDSFGDAGAISIDARTITMAPLTQIRSVTTADADGDAKSVTITGDSITVADDAIITTATLGRGDAGEVRVATKSMLLDGGEVSSSAGVDSSGVAGNVTITATDVTVVNEGVLSTLSANANKAGVLRVTATGQITVDGLGSVISSASIADVRGDAGEVFLTAGGLRLANGGAITTNSVAGAAGDIDIRVPRPGLVILEGGEFPGLILTSSGPGTGGRITLADPLAIISNGGRILALGQQRGANVLIQSRYFINSTDRSNVLSVDGDFELQTGLYDVSSGTVARELSVLDASKVLRGQCPAARSTGAVSQLITRPVGPYAREGTVDVLERPQGSVGPGSCP